MESDFHYKMILNVIVVLHFCIELCNAVVFDYYSGKIASKELQDYYKARGNFDTCTIDIKPCCASERRRVDGSCNNLNNPAKGTFFVRPKRVLPALYYNGSYARKAESGKDLLVPRTIRRVLLSEGKKSDCRFSLAMTSYGIFTFLDIGSIHDIFNFLLHKTDCCTTGETEYMCTPNIVPKDDSLHRLAGIKCLNLTRPLTHQIMGCTNDSIPAPIEQATAVFDLSQIYNFQKKGEKAVRAYKGGLLIMEEENGKMWPQKGPGVCPLNQPDETRCFANHTFCILFTDGFVDPNLLVIQTLFLTWFMRLHNYFATQLAIINPCWDDDTLFYVARDINMAYAMQMYLYEWLASLQGFENLVKSGVISRNLGFRDIYDPCMSPAITLEYTYIIRWFNTAQEATSKLYDEKGTYLRNYPLFNLTTRSGFLVKDKRMEYFTQGHFRQPSGKTDDHVIDYDVAANGLPGLQLALDITASDLHKGRLLGFRPYIDYVYYCTGHKITCFEDLREHVDECKIQELKKVYDHVRDIELMAGLWIEKHLVDGWMPRTLACLFNDNLLKAIRGDRHWYERKYRPSGFTKKQLLQIRKASLAWLLCTVGDSVTEIQEQAFLTIGPENPLVKCRDISGINLEEWADPECSPVYCDK